MFQLLVFLSYFYLFDKSLHKQMVSLLDEVNKLNVRYKRVESLILTESGVMAFNLLLKAFLVIEGKHFFYFILILSASSFLVDYILLDAVFSYLFFFLIILCLSLMFVRYSVLLETHIDGILNVHNIY